MTTLNSTPAAATTHLNGAKDIKVTFESTPNPSTMKFVFSQSLKELVPQQFEFPNVESTDISPLASKLFGFPWVASLMLNEAFIAVTKQDWVDWKVLSSPLAGLIEEHIQSGTPLVTNKPTAAASSEPSDDLATDSDTVKKIKKVLRDEIRPVVALDGGDVVFHSYTNSVLFVQMKGACNGCPSSQATLKEGIEVRLKQAVPEIQAVEAI